MNARMLRPVNQVREIDAGVHKCPRLSTPSGQAKALIHKQITLILGDLSMSTLREGVFRGQVDKRAILGVKRLIMCMLRCPLGVDKRGQTWTLIQGYVC